MTKNARIISYLLGAIMLLPFVSCNTNKENLPPNTLVVSEGFDNPIGLYDNEPSFSWKLPVSENIKSQSAYQVVVASNPKLLPNKADLWDSGEVTSDQSVWVKYGGSQLQSRQKVYWQVMFRDQSGAKSAWSEVANFELGLLKNNDWNAKWIGLPQKEKSDTTDRGFFFHRPQYLIKDFNLSGKIEKARLYITSKGVFEAQINGEKVSKDVMTPGWTPYQKRLETLTYDVTDYLNKGDNVIGAVLGEGWYSGRIGYNRKAWVNKPSPQLLCQLEISYKNGEKQTINSDSGWKGTRNGPILFSGIYDGEVYDANLEMPGWSSPGFDVKDLTGVEAEDVVSDFKLVPKRHATVTDKIELPTLKITEPEPGRFVFDLGQNMVGIPKLKIAVKKDQKVTIRFAEMLQQDGKMYTANYRSAKSTDYYIPKEDGEIIWQPKFTFHGFRYVELSGIDDEVTPEKNWVTGIVQYSDFEKRGTFVSSHDKLNKLQSNINWGLRGNFFDIPTDCPQRDERLGWTGDAQVFAPTSIFNSDVHAFWASWLQSVREEQFADGGIPCVVPNIVGNAKSSGWGDAATVIPWETYFRTGDKKILEDSYQTMLAWINYYKSISENHIPDMFTYGDWLQPFSEHPTNKRKGETDEKLVNTAYYARSVDLTLQTAKVLELNEDVEKLQNWLNEIRMAFQEQFFNEDGSVSKGKSTQTAYLLAIGFNLLTPEMETKAIPHLLAEIEKADNHLRTGFLGTPLLAPVLEKIGRLDLMFGMLFKESYPSWFYSINQGATTMWERWNSYTHKDGFNPGGMNSFNHYAYGAIGQFMYERIAGLSPLEPGYKKILIAPVPGGPLDHAKAEYNSIYGKISSAWKKVNNGLEMDVTIPPNTTAKVVIPMSEGLSLKLNGEPMTGNADIKIVNKNSNNIELELVAGTYKFSTE